MLIEQLLVGLDTSDLELYTTSCWYYRACRAAVAGAGGQLSGPFLHLDRVEQEQAIISLLELSDAIGLPEPRATVPAMARVAVRHPQLNLLNLEAVATGRTLDATIWLSPPAARGALPAVLDAEGVSWTTISMA
ncbi:hypothetical protein BH20ACT4_BH20ACT4_00090 [soil metagenome]